MAELLLDKTLGIARMREWLFRISLTNNWSKSNYNLFTKITEQSPRSSHALRTTGGAFETSMQNAVPGGVGGIILSSLNLNEFKTIKENSSMGVLSFASSINNKFGNWESVRSTYL